MKNVLSIQSHVVYGHAGNSAAVFPMRRLGVEVWPMNAVQFSNHTQYQAGWKGMVLPPSHLTDLADGLEAIGVMGEVDAVLTGYIGAAEQGECILDIVARAKAANPKAMFFCDPVMGHPVKGCKVAPGVAEFHRDRSVAAADVMSPNVLELGRLLGRDLESVGDCLDAAGELLEKGPNLVLVKHLSYAAEDQESFEMILASREEAWHIRRPLVEFAKQPVGVGDLTSGVLLVCLLRGMGVRESLEFTAASVYEVVKETAKRDAFELQEVAAQEAMAKPDLAFRATRLR